MAEPTDNIDSPNNSLAQEELRSYANKNVDADGSEVRKHTFYDPDHEKGKFERYKIILDTRKFEIDLFWRRAAFFWGTIVVLFGVYGFIAKEFPRQPYSWFISLLGGAYNLLFGMSIRASKYWQEHWESHVDNEEESTEWSLFEEDNTTRIASRTEHDNFILKPRRLSLSGITAILCDITLLAWLALIGFELNKLCDQLKFEFSCSSSFHLLTFLSIAFPLLLIVYISLYVWNEIKKNRIRRNRPRRNVTPQQTVTISVKPEPKEVEPT